MSIFPTGGIARSLQRASIALVACAFIGYVVVPALVMFYDAAPY